MGANFNFYATVTNVAENITNNIVNNYYVPVSTMEASMGREQFLLPATEVEDEVQEHTEGITPAEVAPPATGNSHNDNLDDKDQKIRAAIYEWHTSGERQQNHWFAVFKALVSRNLQADDMKAFSDRMIQWGYEEAKHGSILKGNQMGLPEVPSEWIAMQRTEKGKRLKMIQAFLDFRDCLKNQGL